MVTDSSFGDEGQQLLLLSFTGMKIGELLEVSHRHVCPLAIHTVCLCSAHRCSGMEK